MAIGSSYNSIARSEPRTEDILICDNVLGDPRRLVEKLRTTARDMPLEKVHLWRGNDIIRSPEILLETLSDYSESNLCFLGTRDIIKTFLI